MNSDERFKKKVGFRVSDIQRKDFLLRRVSEEKFLTRIYKRIVAIKNI